MNEAYRITFEYQGDRVELKSVRRVVKRVPSGQSLTAREDEAVPGQFVELRGVNGEPLYRRSVPDLIPRTVEYPTGDPERPFGRRVRTEGRRGIGSVLVPALDAARTMAIKETRPARGGGERTKEPSAPDTRELLSVELGSYVERKEQH